MKVFDWISEKVFEMSWVSYPFWFLMENFLFLMVTICLEINYLQWNNEKEDHPKSQKAMLAGLIISFVFFCSMTVVVFYFVIKSIFNLWKWNNWDVSEKETKVEVKEPKTNNYLFGLNNKLSLFPIIHFYHFLGIWMIIALLVFISPLASSKYLWGTLMLL